MNHGRAIASTSQSSENVSSGQGSVSRTVMNHPPSPTAQLPVFPLAEPTGWPRSTSRGQPAVRQIVPLRTCAVSRTAKRLREQIDRDFCRLLATAL